MNQASAVCGDCSRCPDGRKNTVPEPIHKRRGAYLPHWTRNGACYFVTYRTADSLPAHAVEQLKSETRLLERKTQWLSLAPEEIARLDVLKSEAYLRILDNCYGECALKADHCADIVSMTLRHFAEIQYRLWAWCVMPNHVHAVVEPFAGFELRNILHGWKSVSSRRINARLGRTGTFWQPEYFDRLIRDDAEFKKFVLYTLENPAAGGLVDWPWCGRFVA